MKVRDLITKDITVDVYDNIEESLAIAFVGAIELTADGEEEFGEVLNYDVEIIPERYADVAVIDVDGDDWEHRLSRAKDFFESLAGFCTTEEYNRWFKEV